ncbi:MAG TPA: TauD/TfdA family dioxygenase [Kofleriaceae bacterium]|nr:TauD/TfdA family dioxygenase [Kofleriaceae bacterium]
MSRPLSTRALGGAELLQPTHLEPRILCTPAEAGFDPAEDFIAWLRASKDDLFDALHREGALLLRGFPVAGPEAFEALLLALDLDLEISYRGGLSPRSRITERTWTSTEVAEPLVIGYHTEMCYLPRRPRYVAFYCDVAPAEHGETVLFDAAAAWAGLPEPVRARLERLGVKYRRHFPGEAGPSNINKTWKSAFGVDTREELERFLRDEGTAFEWNQDGSVTTEVSLPAVVRHAPTGALCLSVTMNDGYSLTRNFERIADRLAPSVVSDTRQMLAQLERSGYMRNLTGDGEPFSQEMNDAISRAVWDAAILFAWREGDVLLLDNIRMAHGRLNVAGPRRIAAALGNLYDVRVDQVAARP